MLITNTEIQDIIQQARSLTHATPFFFTSRDILQKNYHIFDTLFDGAEINYALKANSDLKILSFLNELGAGFEAASGFEVETLLDLGVEPHRILYGTAIKPSAHIDFAYRTGVQRFAADSREEIKKLAEHAPGAKVCVRTIVDDSGSVFVMSDRFGAPADTVKELMLYAKSLGLKTYGISFYVGSQAAHANMWAKGVQKVAPIIQALYEEGITLEVLNIGGGFPVHYDNHQDAPELHEIVMQLHNELEVLPYLPKLIMEPGRGLVATSTVVVSEVIARSHRAGKPWLCMDAGIYNAFYEAMIHQGATRYPVRPLHPSPESMESLQFTLAGPTGDSLDIIARDVSLPANVDVGDKLVFEHAGAYTLALASRFNGFPEPALYIG